MKKFFIFLIIVLILGAGFYLLNNKSKTDIDEPKTISVEVYFNNSKLDPEISCNKVFPVTRTSPYTQAVGSLALSQLIKGPSQEEKNDGYFTSLPEGVILKKLEIKNKVAYAEFNEVLESGVGGSCRVSAIRSQIIETLKQFDTVDDVVISINGRTDDILQP